MPLTARAGASSPRGARPHLHTIATRAAAVALASGSGFAFALALVFPAPSAAQDLWVDFNSTTQDGGPHLEAGYQAFDAAHEVPATFAGQRSYPAFGTTVTLDVAFPETPAAAAQQAIDRGGANDAEWLGLKLDLLTDWIGVDTRTNNGGNGEYDGVNGDPSPLTLSLGGLPAGAYRWRSYHHDTENIHTDFQIEVSVDGGATFAAPVGGSGTDSSTGGNPETTVYRGEGGQDPAALPSTTEIEFEAGASPVLVRLTPLTGGAVHQQFLVLNGFELSQTGPADGPTAIAISGNTVSRAAAIGTPVGTLTTDDPTPGDTFTYELVTGEGADHNGRFSIGGPGGDVLESDADLSGFATGSVLSVRVRSTDAGGAPVEQAIEITVVNDVDGDGLDDDWELRYFDNDLAAQDGSGDPDGDGLDNLGELDAGSDPTEPDSDSDGIDDGTEVSGGNGYVTDPTDPDSDGDSIPDGDEVAGANGYVTDPSAADSDGDGYPDNVEIASGTDPTDAGDRPAAALPLVLNEIVANNDSGLVDGFDENSDWIEIFNPNDEAVPLAGYSLTDDPERLDKWTFSSGDIPAGGYLVVFASGRDVIDGGLAHHTNFSLDASGEFLAIVRPGGLTVDDAFDPEFPRQVVDISYGRHPLGEGFRYFDTPSPGAANSGGFAEVVADTTFSVDRGFYDEPFEVEIQTATEGATIRYTLDGTLPSDTDGTVYTGPVPVTTTTTLRAIATKPDALATNVDTQTYIFVDDVVNQPHRPEGWPADWGRDSELGRDAYADYEMDPRVDANALPGYSVREALLDIPTISIVMDPEDFLGPRGIYSRPRDRIEKVGSVEYILPDGSSGFQYDCEVEVHGNSSRRPFRMNKHSLRLTFKAELGLAKLRYPLFPQTRNETFNKLVLRACFTDSWALTSWGATRYRPNDSQYIRDVWMKESLRAMGQPSSAGRFCHVYVNGLYFGLHNHTERLEDQFFSDNFGGEPEDWEINKDFDGGGSRWNQLRSAAGAAATGGADGLENLRDFLDVENFADYMLLHYYADSEDWPHHNGYAAANVRSGDGRYRFFVWDQEIVLDKFSWNRYDDSRGPGELFQRLRRNPEFAMLFADRVQKHMFNGGALSLEGSRARYLEIAGWIDKAIVAESARWGDVQSTTPYAQRVDQPRPETNVDHDAYPPAPHAPDIYFTREDSWLVERDNIVDHYLPTLHDPTNARSIVREMRAERLFPSIDAPRFSQHGGAIAPGFELTTAAEHPVWVTTDGSDPRLPGGAVNPSAVELTPAGESTATVELLGRDRPPGAFRYLAPDAGVPAAWTGPEFDDGGWALAPAGSLGAGYERSAPGSYTPEADVDLATVIMDTVPGVYLRYHFDAPDAAGYSSIALEMQYDDGFVAYLNGVQIAASPNAPATPAWDSSIPSADDHEADPGTFEPAATVDLTGQPGLLRATGNVLAVHGINSGASSSDFLIVPRIAATGVVTSGGEPLPLGGSALVKARALDPATSEWSAVTEAFFSAGDLVVSEVHYHPAAEPLSEFIELFNSGEDAVSLAGLRFSAGVEFDFAGGAVTSVGPGGRVLVVRDLATFRATYGDGFDHLIAGEFGGGTALANDGEWLALTDGSGNEILGFAYNDKGFWPASADGGGGSLVFSSADPGQQDSPFAWRPSSEPGGNPGTTDATSFTGDPDTDNDGDGLGRLLEYATGTSDDTGDPSPLSLVTLPDGAIEVSFNRALGADDIDFTIEFAGEDRTWSTAAHEVTLTGRRDLGDGRERLTFRLDDAASTRLARVRVTLR